MAAYTNSRKQDVVLEKTVAKFMDEYLYSQLSVPFERVNDKESQLAGVDVLVNNMAIDEKVKVKGGYLNKVIDYPSFELSFKSQSTGNIVEGWFVKNNLKTDYYAFLSVFISDFNPEKDTLRTSESIKESLKRMNKVVALMVKKSDVFDYITKYETFNDIIIHSNRLRESAWMGDDRKGFSHQKFHLKLSLSYPEQPVNLVIKRDYLKELPHTREIEVTKFGWNRLSPPLV